MMNCISVHEREEEVISGQSRKECVPQHFSTLTVTTKQILHLIMLKIYVIKKTSTHNTNLLRTNYNVQ